MSGINLAPEEKNIWRVVAAVIQLMQGRCNSVGTVTLRANQTTTVVAAPNCGKGSKVFLFPQTLNAAAALSTTYIQAADVLSKSFTVTHASAPSTDRTFSFDARG